MPRVILPDLKPEPASAAGSAERSWAPPSPPGNYALAIEHEVERASRRAPTDHWLRLCERKYSPPPEGFECVLRLTDGSVYLACFWDESENAIEVTISGSRKRRSISRDSVAGLMPVLRAHSFADRRLVLDRQRRGEPGATALPAPAWQPGHHAGAGDVRAIREHEIARARKMLRETPSIPVVEIMRSAGLSDHVVRRLRAEVAAERPETSSAAE